MWTLCAVDSRDRAVGLNLIIQLVELLLKLCRSGWRWEETPTNDSSAKPAMQLF